MINKSIIFIVGVSFLLAGCGGTRKMITQKDQVIAEQDQLAKDLWNQISDMKQKEQILIQEKGDMTTITLPNAILFTSGSIRLTSEGQQIIDEIWKVLMRYPDRDIMIQGYTDNVPIAQKFQGKYKSNWELSSSRAHSVLHYVISKEGAHPERLAAVGYGEFRPVADNANEEGKAKNRRVVIAVSGKKRNN
ncbi:MAG: OmpA family protein [Elusimicrobiota bacterium]